MTGRTLFAIGSTTKAFTAVGLGILRDEDRLDWLEPSEPFRTKCQYQNLMYMTAGHLAGEISGRGWKTFTRQRLLDPLGMSRTTFFVDSMQTTDDYVATYSNPGYGTFEVTMEGDGPVGRYGRFSSTLRHQQYDVFELRPEVGEQTFKGNIEMGMDGTIRSNTEPYDALGASEPFRPGGEPGIGEGQYKIRPAMAAAPLLKTAFCAIRGRLQPPVSRHHESDSV